MDAKQALGLIGHALARNLPEIRLDSNWNA
jgi:hypothetical protein